MVRLELAQNVWLRMYHALNRSSVWSRYLSYRIKAEIFYTPLLPLQEWCNFSTVLKKLTEDMVNYTKTGAVPRTCNQLLVLLYLCRHVHTDLAWRSTFLNVPTKSYLALYPRNPRVSSSCRVPMFFRTTSFGTSRPDEHYLPVFGYEVFRNVNIRPQESCQVTLFITEPRFICLAIYSEIKLLRGKSRFVFMTYTQETK